MLERRVKTESQVSPASLVISDSPDDKVTVDLLENKDPKVQLVFKEIPVCLARKVTKEV